jgi:hypothetical protein
VYKLKLKLVLGNAREKFVISNRSSPKWLQNACGPTQESNVNLRRSGNKFLLVEAYIQSNDNLNSMLYNYFSQQLGGLKPQHCIDA